MEEDDIIREAMRAIGRRTSERKAATSRANGMKSQVTDEMRAKMKEAQLLRREREKAERFALGLDTAPVEKKSVGRPKKVQSADAAIAGTDSPKRGRGRPRKSETGIEMPNAQDTPENGTQSQTEA